ncbi:hypothetical protein D9756_000031 [Leucocoprinus leucothites]|uniref:Uncharacterized protein n=1 Tax=Leucocoprinus leucothites TaxID=201217 RepID=A0A8H5LN91_9AGAR|nr:hypothetical protein D9756_000031 [Leucoagaricus leucothites]
MQPDSARVQGSDWIISALRRILVLAYPLTSDPPTTAPLAVARPSTTSMPNLLLVITIMVLQVIYDHSLLVTGPTPSPHYPGSSDDGVQYGSHSVGLYVSEQGDPHTTDEFTARLLRDLALKLLSSFHISTPLS